MAKTTIYNGSHEVIGYYEPKSNGRRFYSLQSNAKNYKLNATSGNDEIQNYGSKVSINGNAGNDYIINVSGKNVTLNGGNGSDAIVNSGSNSSISGGNGNDSLWGGNGADKFIYSNGDGKDVIFGFENSDMLQITGAFSASYNKSKKELYFNVGSTAETITLKNFTASSFNVNGTNYKISGSNLVKK